jgi:wyosine [tRNA(Phe)-imidazoG37] synthetase (radical SAM superfamily)
MTTANATAFDRVNRPNGGYSTQTLVTSLFHLEELRTALRTELFHRFDEDGSLELTANDGAKSLVAKLVTPRPDRCEACEHQTQRRAYITVTQQGDR